MPRSRPARRARTPEPSRVLRLAAVIAVLLVAATGCGGDDGHHAWRDLELQVPDGWVVFEESPTVLGLANAPLGVEQGAAGDRVVAAQFTYEPRSASPGVWRAWVDEQPESDLESDTAIEIDGVPATRLVFSHDANGIPTREMVVVVPSRGLYILMQPVPEIGDTEAPDLFLENIERFDTILASIDFGAPISE